jgi:hypothetical protein
MFHHFLQRGHALSSLINLTETEKLFYIASMELEFETGEVGKDG